ncbi:unnamed protein product [Choristocarpus tenellus]
MSSSGSSTNSSRLASGWNFTCANLTSLLSCGIQTCQHSDTLVQYRLVVYRFLMCLVTNIMQWNCLSSGLLVNDLWLSTTRLIGSNLDIMVFYYLIEVADAGRLTHY